MVAIANQRNKPPHYIVFGVEKRISFDLLNSPPNLVYNVDDCGKSQTCFLKYS